MTSQTQPTILVIGSNTSLHYLLGRFAERSGYRLKVHPGCASGGEIAALNPAVIIFLSTEALARDQACLRELASLETPIIVCSSILEEAKAIELGADYCLLHPLTYDDFQAALAHARASKRV